MIIMLKAALSRNHGVSIFIDYCTVYSRRDTEKGGRKGKRHRIDKQNEVNSCAAWGYLVPHGLR